MLHTLHMFVNGCVKIKWSLAATPVSTTLTLTDIAARDFQPVCYPFLHFLVATLHCYTDKLSIKLTAFMYISSFSQTNLEMFHSRKSCTMQEMYKSNVLVPAFWLKPLWNFQNNSSSKQLQLLMFAYLFTVPNLKSFGIDPLPTKKIYTHFFCIVTSFV